MTNHCSPDTDVVQSVYDALLQAQDCIRGETPEDVTDAEAREDTINKVRGAMRTIEDGAIVAQSTVPDRASPAFGYALRLLEHFVSEHFPHNPDWKPCDDLMGVLTQLDNAITIIRDYKEKLRAYEGTSVAQTPSIADWSTLPRDLYVISVKSGDSIVFDVQCCSVPMAIGPEIRYSLAGQPPSPVTDDYTKGYRDGWNDREARVPAQPAPTVDIEYELFKQAVEADARGRPAQSSLTVEDVYANCATTLLGFRDELTERNRKFICDQISRKVMLALSSVSSTHGGE